MSTHPVDKGVRTRSTPMYTEVTTLEADCDATSRKEEDMLRLSEISIFRPTKFRRLWLQSRDTDGTKSGDTPKKVQAESGEADEQLLSANGPLCKSTSAEGVQEESATSAEGVHFANDWIEVVIRQATKCDVSPQAQAPFSVPGAKITQLEDVPVSASPKGKDMPHGWPHGWPYGLPHGLPGLSWFGAPVFEFSWPSGHEHALHLQLINSAGRFHPLQVQRGEADDQLSSANGRKDCPCCKGRSANGVLEEYGRDWINLLNPRATKCGHSPLILCPSCIPRPKPEPTLLEWKDKLDDPAFISYCLRFGIPPAPPGPKPAFRKQGCEKSPQSKTRPAGQVQEDWSDWEHVNLSQTGGGSVNPRPAEGVPGDWNEWEHVNLSQTGGGSVDPKVLNPSSVPGAKDASGPPLHVCANACGAEKPGGRRLGKICGGCGRVAYCGDDCRWEHWRKSHKHECDKAGDAWYLLQPSRNTGSKVQRTDLAMVGSNKRVKRISEGRQSSRSAVGEVANPDPALVGINKRANWMSEGRQFSRNAGEDVPSNDPALPGRKKWVMRFSGMRAVLEDPEQVGDWVAVNPTPCPKDDMDDDVGDKDEESWTFV